VQVPYDRGTEPRMSGRARTDKSDFRIDHSNGCAYVRWYYKTKWHIDAGLLMAKSKCTFSFFCKHPDVADSYKNIRCKLLRW